MKISNFFRFDDCDGQNWSWPLLMYCTRQQNKYKKTHFPQKLNIWLRVSDGLQPKNIQYSISVIEGAAPPFVFQTFDSPNLSPLCLQYTALPACLAEQARSSWESQMFVRKRGGCPFYHWNMFFGCIHEQKEEQQYRDTVSAAHLNYMLLACLSTVHSILMYFLLAGTVINFNVLYVYTKHAKIIFSDFNPSWLTLIRI